MKPQLAIIRGCVQSPANNGRLVEIICRVPPNEEWTTSSGNRFFKDGTNSFAVRSLGAPFKLSAGPIDMECVFVDWVVFPINDNPGNENWVTEARNKLKGKTEITERGELA